MTDDIIKSLVGAIITLLTSLNTVLLWQIRDMGRKHDQSLYGANGDNGLTADLKLVRERTHEHLSHITAHEMRLSVLEGQVGKPNHHLNAKEPNGRSER